MKTIVDNNGKVLYATLVDIDLQENEIQIDALLTENFITPYWNFETLSFYEGATQEEIAQAQTPTLTVDEVIIDLVTKQVEIMNEEEKNDLIQLLNP